MKESISHLPMNRQRQLHNIVTLILDRIPQTEMVILYGSYARGNYVEFDERKEFGVPTYYQSDYDLLVVTSGAREKEVDQKLHNITDIYYKSAPELTTPLQLISEDIKKLNKDLSDGRYFYTDIIDEGIVLYDSNKFELAPSRKLQYDEVKKQAEEYFGEKYQEAVFAYDDAQTNYQKERYRRASFHLHQTTENLLHAVRMVYTLHKSKQHNIADLLKLVNRYSPGFKEIFPLLTNEDKRLFKLLKDAYVNARYNPDFLVTKEDIDALSVIIEKLFDLVKKVCEKRIGEYEEMK